ncbi:hypothetical protein KIPB_007993, partial [Kipferlia bialata]|eukprot:g7993.t1
MFSGFGDSPKLDLTPAPFAPVSLPPLRSSRPQIATIEAPVASHFPPSPHQSPSARGDSYLATRRDAFSRAVLEARAAVDNGDLHKALGLFTQASKAGQADSKETSEAVFQRLCCLVLL